MYTYIAAFIVLSAVLAAHIFGLDGLYFQIPGYDIMMHLLGGAGISLFLTAMVRSQKKHIPYSRRLVVFGVLVVGLVWEGFEIYYRLTGYDLWTKLYYIDTVKDLINDTIGGAVVAYISGHYIYKGQRELAAPAVQKI